MKRALSTLILASAIFGWQGFNTSAYAQESEASVSGVTEMLGIPPLVSNFDAQAPEPEKTVEIVIDFVDDIDEDAPELNDPALHINSVHAYDERLYIKQVPASQLMDTLAALRRDPLVEHAEENYVYSIPENEIGGALGSWELDKPIPVGDDAPNDPLYKLQWNMQMIGTTAAHRIGNGDGVIVAVIDTGVTADLEDLEKDRFVPGYDFVNDTEVANDDHGHGSHVAGTIAQTTNNGIGVSGVAPGAKIMPLKVLSRNGSGTVADIADAIRFAADEGAQVINMSLGSTMPSGVMESAVKYAYDKGVVIICAAGNSGGRHRHYPSGYKECESVTSVGPDKKLAFYSTYGPDTFIAAPGGNKQINGELGGILQNTVDPSAPGHYDTYLSFQGTSMAAPHVAGVAALVISHGVTNPDEVREVLAQSAERVSGEKRGDRSNRERYGAGIVNAHNAVTLAVHDAELSTLWGALNSLFMAIFGVVFIKIKWGVRAMLKSFGGLVAPPVLVAATVLFGGPMWHTSALLASVLPVVVAAMFFYGKVSRRPWLMGLTASWAAYLLISAVFLPANIVFIPGVAGILDRIWLGINGIGALLLAFHMGRRELEVSGAIDVLSSLDKTGII